MRAQEADEVVAVLLGSDLSGTFNAAQAAIRAGGLAEGPPGGQPVGLTGCRDSWHCGGPSWPSPGWTGARIAEELQPDPGPVRHASDGGPVRQSAPVRPDLPGQGVAGRDARREAHPLARCRWTRGSGRAGPGAGECRGPRAGPAGPAADAAPEGGAFRRGARRCP